MLKKVIKVIEIICFILAIIFIVMDSKKKDNETYNQIVTEVKQIEEDTEQIRSDIKQIVYEVGNYLYTEISKLDYSKIATIFFIITMVLSLFDFSNKETKEETKDTIKIKKE